MKSTPKSTPPPRPRPVARPRLTNGTGRIRIVIADSQTMDRRGMAALLTAQPDFEVVGETVGVDDSVRACHALEPDVLVLSLGITGITNDSVVAEIRDQVPGLRILAVSERSNSGCWVLNPPSRQLRMADHDRSCLGGTDCLQIAATHGALGTIRRSAEPSQLFQAIRAVAAGSAWYEPLTAARLVNGAGTLDTSAPQMLSARELDVAALLGEGLSNKEISGALGISEPTVKKHVGRILGKLGLQDRLQAGLFVARNPLLLKRWATAIA